MRNTFIAGTIVGVLAGMVIGAGIGAYSAEDPKPRMSMPFSDAKVTYDAKQKTENCEQHKDIAEGRALAADKAMARKDYTMAQAHAFTSIANSIAYQNCKGR